MAAIYTKLYIELQQRLFVSINPECADFVEFFFQNLAPKVLKELADNGRISPDQQMIFPESKKHHFVAKPFPKNEPCNIRYSGNSYIDEIMKCGNDYYYIIALWILWYDENKHSSLGREIVRAFIINSIYVMNKEAQLLSDGVKSGIDRAGMEKKTMGFYTQIFDFQSIFYRMRREFKERLKAHISNGVSLNKITSIINENIDQDEIENLEKRGFSKFSEIFSILAKANKEDGFKLGGLLLLLKNSHDKRKIKHVIADLVIKLVDENKPKVA